MVNFSLMLLRSLPLPISVDKDNFEYSRGVTALIAFAALMGVAEPRLPHQAQIADGLALLALITMATRLRRMPLAWMAYLGWALSVAALRHDAGKLLGVAELACLAALAASLDEDEREKVVRAWVLGAAVLACVALLVSGLSLLGVSNEWTSGGGEMAWQFRPKGLARSTNLLASLCLVPFLVAWHERRRGLTLLFGALLLLSLSRTLLAAAVGIVLLERPRWKWLIAPLALAAVASMYVDIHGAAPGIRWRIASSALQTIAQHPLFGVEGAPASAGWPGAADPPLPWDAHSTLLDVAATLGLPALFAFAALLLTSLRRARGLLAIALVAMLFDAMTIDVEDFRHFWLLLGLVLAF
jgi:hypothetical protein